MTSTRLTRLVRSSGIPKTSKAVSTFSVSKSSMWKFLRPVCLRCARILEDWIDRTNHLLEMQDEMRSDFQNDPDFQYED